jgi:hypothetical protein
MISGPSQCGKTCLTLDLLKNAEEMFEDEMFKIIYCYGAYQPCFAKFKEQIPNIKFVQGFPEDILDFFENQPGILIVDDLMGTCSNDQLMADIMTKHSHHRNITVIYIVQNLFPPGKFSRTISLNCHYIFAFKNCRDSLGISTLVQQVFCNKKDRLHALESFQDTTDKTYGYLLFDMHPTTPKSFRLRTNIFPNEQHMAYVKL